MSQGEPQAASQGVTLEQAAPVLVQQQEASSSCRKKWESGTFLGNVMGHIDEFVHASYDDHKKCFHETLSEVVGMITMEHLMAS